MPSLPREIWLHIAQFMNPDDLQPLISLNRIVFDIVMDYRYRQMTFAYIDKRMVRNLTRLKDPAVAKRVRILYIYPGFIDEAMSNESESAMRQTVFERFLELGSLFLQHKIFTKVKSKLSIVRMLQRTEDLVKIMLDVLSGLPNVTDYYVTWCGLPSITAMSIPFLSAVFRSNLRKLSLDLSLENVRNILTPSFYIKNLEELRLCIHGKDSSVDVYERDVILSKHLAPAINNLRASLHTLSIEAKEPSDLSSMFYAMQWLPALQDLAISIPGQSPHLGDPEGFTTFFNKNCANIRILRLRVSQIDRSDPPPDEISFEAWIREAVCAASLPKLRMLEITSQLFPPTAAEACVRRFACSIRTLTVTGHHRPHGRVEDLLDIILACRDSPALGQDLPLERLRLGVEQLSPQLVALFASKLPNLQRLELLAKCLVPHPSQRLQWLPPRTDGQKFTQIDNFLEEMQDLILPSWQLRHMSLFVEHLPMSQVYKPILEEIFLQSIPSLKSFR